MRTRHDQSGWLRGVDPTDLNDLTRLGQELSAAAANTSVTLIRHRLNQLLARQVPLLRVRRSEPGPVHHLDFADGTSLVVAVTTPGRIGELAADALLGRVNLTGVSSSPTGMVAEFSYRRRVHRLPVIGVDRQDQRISRDFR